MKNKHIKQSKSFTDAVRDELSQIQGRKRHCNRYPSSKCFVAVQRSIPTSISIHWKQHIVSNTSVTPLKSFNITGIANKVHIKSYKTLNHIEYMHFRTI